MTTSQELRCVISDLMDQVRERDTEIERLRAEVDRPADPVLEVQNNAAVAAIQYVLANQCESPMEFLNCWVHGEFDALRKEWENVPEEVFIGADPLHKQNGGE